MTGKELIIEIREKYGDQIKLFLSSNICPGELPKIKEATKANDCFKPDIEIEHLKSILLSDDSKIENSDKTLEIEENSYLKVVSDYFHDITKPALSAHIVLSILYKNSEISQVDDNIKDHQKQFYSYLENINSLTDKHKAKLTNEDMEKLITIENRFKPQLEKIKCYIDRMTTEEYFDKETIKSVLDDLVAIKEDNREYTKKYLSELS